MYMLHVPTKRACELLLMYVLAKHVNSVNSTRTFSLHWSAAIPTKSLCEHLCAMGEIRLPVDQKKMPVALIDHTSYM